MLAGATLFGRSGSGIAVNLPLTSSLAGKVAGGLTYTRAFGQLALAASGELTSWGAELPAFPATFELLRSCVAIGDSLTFNGVYLSTLAARFGIPSITNKGVGGNTLTQMQARFATDVVDLAPRMTIIMGGINDIITAGASPVSTMTAKTLTMIAQAQSAGIFVVMGCMGPFGGNAAWSEARQGWHSEYNTWLKSYCAANDIPVFDTYEILREPEANTIKAAWDSGDGLHPNTDGYTNLASGMQPVIAGISDATAIMLEPESINKLTCYGASPTDLTGVAKSGNTSAQLSVVDDAAELTLSGLSLICTSGMVFKLDNSLGGAGDAYAIFTATVGNLEPHSLSVYARTSPISGANALRLLYDDAGSQSTFTPVSSTYRRYSIENKVPSQTYRKMGIAANIGTIVYFVLPQLEEIPFTTSPIPTAGAAATRAATVPSFSTAGLRTINISGKFTWTPSAASQGVRWLWGSYLDANNYVGVLHDGTNLIFRKRIAGVNYDATKALTYAAGTAYNIGFRLSANGGSDIFINSVKGTANANAASIVYGTTIKLGQDGNGGSLQAGSIKDFKIYSRVLVDGSF